MLCHGMLCHRILKGNLSPGGAVAKITGKEGLRFTGRARAFDSEDDFVHAVESGSIKKGEKTVVVLRYLGPKGGPGACLFVFVLVLLSPIMLGGLLAYLLYVAITPSLLAFLLPLFSSSSSSSSFPPLVTFFSFYLRF